MRRHILRTVALLVVGLSVMPAAPSGGAAGCQWRQVGKTLPEDLEKVAARTSSDVWVTGQQFHLPSEAFAFHWNGREWRRAQLPPRLSRVDVLLAVERGDVWAGGVESDFTTAAFARWHRGRWRALSHAGLPAEAAPKAISATASGAVWIAGTRLGRHSSRIRGFVARWGGRRWTWVKTPDLGPHGFHAIAAIGRNDVWVGGRVGQRPLLEHWDGTRWKLLDQRALRAFARGPWALAASAANDIWALAHEGTRKFAHWDGMRWSVVSGPAIPNGAFENVGASSRRNAWAAGDAFDGRTSRAAVGHWDGRRWTRVPGPHGDRAIFEDVSVASDGSAWVVGLEGYVYRFTC